LNEKEVMLVVYGRHFNSILDTSFLGSDQYQKQDGDAKTFLILNLIEVVKQVLRHPKQ
jgi:hypothetical protein